MKRPMMFLSALCLSLAAGAVPATSAVVARQMWPWSAEYRISFRAQCALSESWDVSLIVSNGTDEYVIPNGHLAGDVREIGPGEHIAVWDPSSGDAPADWLKANADRLAFTVRYTANATPPEYLIVDLSGGSAAESYPVSTVTGGELVKWGAVGTNGYWTADYKTTKLAMRRIRAGSYVAGPRAGERGVWSHEKVGVNVTLTNDFWLGVFELTHKQVELVQGLAATAGTENYAFNGSPRYVFGYEGTNWPYHATLGAESVCGLLTAKADLPAHIPAGWKFFLPSEAQWEYACRAGTASAYNNGTDPAPYTQSGIEYDDNLAPIAWYRGNLYVWRTYTVGLKQPNNWGLFDMHGNASELCATCNVGEMWGGTEPIGTTSYWGTKGGLAYWCVRGGNMRSRCFGYYTAETVQQYRSGARDRMDSGFGPSSGGDGYLGYRLALRYLKGTKD